MPSIFDINLNSIKSESFRYVNLAQEAAQKAAKEAAQKAAKEAAQKAAKEAAQKAAKEAAEKSAKEAAQKAAKESGQKAAKEASQKAAKEASEKAAKEASQKAQKEAGQKAQKEAAQKAQKEAGQKVQKQAADNANNFLNKCKQNPKFCALGITATGVAAYAAATGKSFDDAFKDLAEMAGDAAKDAVNAALEELGLPSLGSITETVKKWATYAFYAIVIYIIVMYIYPFFSNLYHMFFGSSDIVVVQAPSVVQAPVVPSAVNSGSAAVQQAAAFLRRFPK